MMNSDQTETKLRGHSSGVTSLTYGTVKGKNVIISGDKNGSLIFWDIDILRLIKRFDNICESQVQSLRMLKLMMIKEECDIIVAQSRDDGIKIFKLVGPITEVDLNLNTCCTFPTYPSLFSRGDAVSVSSSEAILAHPSSLDIRLITIRYLGPDADTVIAGSAQRGEAQTHHNCSVFDARLHRSDLTATVPELGATGLQIDLIFKHNTGFQDFISAYDFYENANHMVIICGSTKKELIELTCDKDFKGEPSMKKINIKNQGVSALVVGSNHGLVAMASWSNALRLFDLQSHREISVLRNHFDQVQDIIFVDRSSLDSESSGRKVNLCAASLDGTISVSLVNRFI